MLDVELAADMDKQCPEKTPAEQLAEMLRLAQEAAQRRLDAVIAALDQEGFTIKILEQRVNGQTVQMQMLVARK